MLHILKKNVFLHHLRGCDYVHTLEGKRIVASAIRRDLVFEDEAIKMVIEFAQRQCGQLFQLHVRVGREVRITDEVMVMTMMRSQ